MTPKANARPASWMQTRTLHCQWVCPLVTAGVRQGRGVTFPSLLLWEGTLPTLASGPKARCPAADFSSLPSEMTKCQKTILLQEEEG